eukprot:2618168-Rhodomonas_salina.1
METCDPMQHPSADVRRREIVKIGAHERRLCFCHAVEDRSQRRICGAFLLGCRKVCRKVASDTVCDAAQ